MAVISIWRMPWPTLQLPQICISYLVKVKMWCQKCYLNNKILGCFSCHLRLAARTTAPSAEFSGVRPLTGELWCLVWTRSAPVTTQTTSQRQSSWIFSGGTLPGLVTTLQFSSKAGFFHRFSLNSRFFSKFKQISKPNSKIQQIWENMGQKCNFLLYNLN